MSSLREPAVPPPSRLWHCALHKLTHTPGTQFPDHPRGQHHWSRRQHLLHLRRGFLYHRCLLDFEICRLTIAPFLLFPILYAVLPHENSQTSITLQEDDCKLGKLPVLLCFRPASVLLTTKTTPVCPLFRSVRVWEEGAVLAFFPPRIKFFTSCSVN